MATSAPQVTFTGRTFPKSYVDLSVDGASAEVATDTENSRRYIRGQVIITGHIGDINKALAALDKGLGVLKGPSPTIPLVGGRIIGRYTFEEPTGGEPTFVKAFNEHVGATPSGGRNASDRSLYAELNYVVRQPRGPGIEGDPGGSGIEGDPATIPAHLNASVDDFMNQWAFCGKSSIQLDGFFDYNTKAYKGEYGKDVRILIFDSSPLCTGTYMVKLGEFTLESGKTVKFPEYPLVVSALLDDALKEQSDSALKDKCNESVKKHPVDSHGLFVANLAHAVAPRSTIHLIQVLKYDEKKGLLRGDLFTLLNALQLYLGSGESVPKKIVVNLSLGFDVDFDIIDPTWRGRPRLFRNWLRRSAFYPNWFRRLGGKTIKADSPPGYFEEVLTPVGPTQKRALYEVDTEPRAETRKTASDVPGHVQDPPESAVGSHPETDDDDSTHQTRAPVDREIKFVAAAGNDGQSEPQPPGTHANVLGVSALNYGGAKAFFSNQGEMGAPGGGGTGRVARWREFGFLPWILTKLGLLIVRTFNPGDKNRTDAVMSIVKPDYTKDRYSYAHWAGTSFAAPLVSGLEAVALADPSMAGPSEINNVQVEDEIATASAVLDDADAAGGGTS